MFDYLIKNAMLVDGLGGQPVTGNLAIKEGLIVGVGEVDGQAKETIDGPRQKAFCARSKSWKGERGKAARRRWGCR